MGTWRTLHSQQILHAPGAISVYGGVSLGKLRTRAFRSGAECFTGHSGFPNLNEIHLAGVNCIKLSVLNYLLL